MSSPIALSFKYQSHTLRIVDGTDGPEWVAEDVCRAIGLGDVRAVLAALPSGETGVQSSGGAGAKRGVPTVTEAGLYRIAFQSDSAEAGAFLRWLMGEAMPTIRQRAAAASPLPSPSPAPVQRVVAPAPAATAPAVASSIAVDLSRELGRLRTSISDLVSEIRLLRSSGSTTSRQVPAAPTPEPARHRTPAAGGGACTFNITEERPISLHEARKLPILKQEDGTAPHWQTINSWVRVGIRGIKLQHALLPRGTVTSELCVIRFLERLTAAAQVDVPYELPPDPTTAHRKKQIDRAMEIVTSG